VAFSSAESLTEPSDRLPADPWRACYQQLAPRLVLYARQWVGSQADAEDVVQAAFVRFWRHRPDAEPEHYPLLYTAVRTSALDLLRGNERRVRREADERVEVLRGDTPCFDATVEQREHGEAVETALARLPQEQREVIVLKIWGDLTFAQIAQTLDESINTIASRYRYALEALRRHFQPHANEYERV
jgi:RNA polymerase sigma-70 factor, ECF subfamily